ncbi:hypothetical protein RUM44_004663 [Polyplax serrata]|uniref:Hormone-sensitive lipase n=1 Tax=Polyplax serrata TaxID=468196 RepID=A0ABR1B3J3_POLSC
MEEACDKSYVNELIQICGKNAEYYEKDETENGQRMYLAFLGIVDHVNTILPLVANIEKIMGLYDFDDQTPGNGYRSFVIIAQISIKHALQLCNYVAVNKDFIIFRKGLYVKEIEAISHMIASLATCFKHLCTLVNWSETGELFPSAEHYSEVLLQQSDTVNQYAFYGRCLGIQFCQSVQPLLRMIAIFMASFSEMYYNIGSFSAKAHGLYSGGKFLLDPELRAQRIVNISQHANIDFCKAFWFLTESELMKKIPDFMCSAMAVNIEIQIPPEPLKIENSLGVDIEIPIPSSHVPVSSIQVRLLSSTKREGMIAVWSDTSKKHNILPPSKSLILHCHGGGFVAQSSKSHEVYLREWACILDVPIVSVDYSLAPEAPFPRALEEVFYSYCWVLKNSHILGSTGENIILAGDSAGANLILGTALKCIEYSIRKPNGLFLAYVPVIVSSTPSPSRLLCLMDPLLPIGFLLRCLKAYACPDPIVIEKGEENSEAEASDLTESVQNACNLLQIDNKNNASETSQPTCSPDLISGCERNGRGNHFLDVTTDSNGSLPVSQAKSSEIEKATEATEKNYKNTFNSMRKKVTNLVVSTLRLDSKPGTGKVVNGNEPIKLSSSNSFKDLKFLVPKDPYLSPYWASDDKLRQMPPISICSVEFDPCLDDCVMFAKKLKRLGNTVTLDILSGLPHGFLNLSKINKDAEKGSKFCIERIKELLSRGSGQSKNCSDVNENLSPTNNVACDS